MTIFWKPQEKGSRPYVFCLISFIYLKFPKTNLKINLSIKQFSFLANTYVPRPLSLVRCCVSHPSNFAVLPSEFPGSLSVSLQAQIQAIFCFPPVTVPTQARISNFITKEHFKTIFRNCLKNRSFLLSQNWIYILQRRKTEQLLQNSFCLSQFSLNIWKTPESQENFDWIKTILNSPRNLWIGKKFQNTFKRTHFLTHFYLLEKTEPNFLKCTLLVPSGVTLKSKRVRLWWLLAGNEVQVEIRPLTHPDGGNPSAATLQRSGLLLCETNKAI